MPNRRVVELDSLRSLTATARRLTSSPSHRTVATLNNARTRRRSISEKHSAQNGYPATSWFCKGFGDDLQGAFDRWHITSTDLNPECLPLLKGIATRKFCHGVAFHGFAKQADDADLYIGGGASDPLKGAILCELEAANLSLQIRIATEDDDPKFQGRKPENLINRLAAQGIHIEQSAEAREFSERIAKAIATVYRSPIRRFLCALTNLFR
jgi:hypothetical protein